MEMIKKGYMGNCEEDPRRGWPLTARKPVTVTRRRQLVAGGNQTTFNVLAPEFYI
jgi:hypothetical protein